MIAPMQFMTEVKSRAVDYRSLSNHPEYECSMSPASYDMNLFLPVRKREKFLRPCVSRLREAASAASIKVRIVVVENDKQPAYKGLCNNLGLDYIFIPSDELRSQGLFEKSLCYNVGFLVAPQTEWAVYHDLDILVEPDYFKNVLVHLARKPKWLQPYQKQRVRMLSPYATILIVDGADTKSREWLLDNSYPSKPGSPGGSIVVRSMDFAAVGGYDPEIFYGYSPEDAFFWVKLELLHKHHEGLIRSHFLGSASYADSPMIDVFHMDHPAASGTNPRYNWMLELLEAFYLYDNHVRMDIISQKSRMLLQKD
jgi:hypothetical protein